MIFCVALPPTGSGYKSVITSNNGVDLAFANLDFPTYCMFNQSPFLIKGSVNNAGSDTINFFTINYCIDGGQVISELIDSLSLISQTTFDFIHPVSWIPNTTGEFVLDVWSSDPNGITDGDSTNDHIRVSITVLDTFVVRNTCIEMFTGNWCGPCYFMNLDFNNNVLPHIDNFTLIKYHIGPDPYATWEGHNRAGYYASNSVPDIFWDGERNSNYTTAFSSFQSKPAFIFINITNATYKDSTIYVSGEIMPITDHASGNYSYQIVVVEKVNYLYPTGNQLFFDNIQIEMSPSETGTPIANLNASAPIPFSHIIPLQLSHVQSMSGLNIVVLVQNNDNKKILQSASLDIVYSDTTFQIPDRTLIGSINIFPNPSQNKITITSPLSNLQTYSIALLDITGRNTNSVSSNPFNPLEQIFEISNLSSGIYSLVLRSEKEIIVKKILKQ